MEQAVKNFHCPSLLMNNNRFYHMGTLLQQTPATSITVRQTGTHAERPFINAFACHRTHQNATNSSSSGNRRRVDYLLCHIIPEPKKKPCAHQAPITPLCTKSTPCFFPIISECKSGPTQCSSAGDRSTRLNLSFVKYKNPFTTLRSPR